MTLLITKLEEQGEFGKGLLEATTQGFVNLGSQVAKNAGGIEDQANAIKALGVKMNDQEEQQTRALADAMTRVLAEKIELLQTFMNNALDEKHTQQTINITNNMDALMEVMSTRMAEMQTKLDAQMRAIQTVSDTQTTGFENQRQALTKGIRESDNKILEEIDSSKQTVQDLTEKFETMVLGRHILNGTPVEVEQNGVQKDNDGKKKGIMGRLPGALKKRPSPGKDPFPQLEKKKDEKDEKDTPGKGGKGGKDSKA
jgi:hypothetical protein